MDISTAQTLGVVVMVGAGVIGVASTIGGAVYRARSLRVALRHVSGRFGLEYDAGSLLNSASARGIVEGFALTIDAVSVGSGDASRPGTRVSITPHMPTGLRLLRSDASPDKPAARATIETGDAVFDRRIEVDGPKMATRALLDQSTRRAVLAAVNRSAAMNGGVIIEGGTVAWFEVGVAKTKVLAHAVELVLDLAQRLSRPADDAALAEIVRTDEIGVAVEALRAMPAGAERDALDAEIVQTHADAKVMIVARRTGANAASGVLAVLENTANPDTLRADALTWLGAHTDASAQALMHLAPERLTRPVIAAAALVVLLQAKACVPLTTLARVIENVDLAPTGLRLARLHGAAAEPLLIETLASKHAGVARSAADWLALDGTSAAVMALREKTKGIFVDAQLKAAALAAIASIQDRAGVADGGLALVEASAAGQLSETQE